MYVFRVETENGEGPYTSDKYRAIARPLGMKHTGCKLRPSPYTEDFSNFYNYHFGFSSIKLFREWFGDSWAELKKMGCRLKAYRIDAEHVMCGSKQVCFRKERATLIREFVI
jgi:hypothetical protein